MSTIIMLKVGDKEVQSTKVTYDDLVILYNQFIDTYGEVPVYSKCDSKHNMPQGRIINRVLKENNVTYNDFLLQFGKVSHVRTESKDYDLYVKNLFESESITISTKFIDVQLPEEYKIDFTCREFNFEKSGYITPTLDLFSGHFNKFKENLCNFLSKINKG